MKTILKLLVTALSVVLLTYLLPGVGVGGFFDAFIVAVVLAVLRLIVRPVLVFLTLPATIVSLGLFLFVINACIILMADYFVTGFRVNGFFWALIFSILLSFVQSVLHKILGTEEEE